MQGNLKVLNSDFTYGCTYEQTKENFCILTVFYLSNLEKDILKTKMSANIWCINEKSKKILYKLDWRSNRKRSLKSHSVIFKINIYFLIFCVIFINKIQ